MADFISNKNKFIAIREKYLNNIEKFTDGEVRELHELFDDGAKLFDISPIFVSAKDIIDKRKPAAKVSPGDPKGFNPKLPHNAWGNPQEFEGYFHTMANRKGYYVRHKLIEKVYPIEINGNKLIVSKPGFNWYVYDPISGAVINSGGTSSKDKAIQDATMRLNQHNDKPWTEIVKRSMEVCTNQNLQRAERDPYTDEDHKLDVKIAAEKKHDAEVQKLIDNAKKASLNFGKVGPYPAKSGASIQSVRKDWTNGTHSDFWAHYYHNSYSYTLLDNTGEIKLVDVPEDFILDNFKILDAKAVTENTDFLSGYSDDKSRFESMLDLYIKSADKFNAAEIKDLNDVFKMGMEMYGSERVLPVVTEKPDPDEYTLSVPEEAKEVPTSKLEKLQDYGEKIGGAKKDWRDKLDFISKDDIINLPISKSFPEPDYTQLFKDGVITQEGAIFIRYLYKNIPPKPRLRNRVRVWVSKVEGAIEICREVVSNPTTKNVDYTKKVLEYYSHREDYRLLSELLKELNFPEEPVEIGDYKLYSHINGNYIIGSGGMVSARVTYPTIKDAAQAIKKMLDSNEKKDEKRQTKFNVYRDVKEKNYFIGKKGAKDVIRIMGGFATDREAFDFMKNKHDELQAIWDAMKFEINERRMANRPRIGLDWRKGENITSEKFAKTFGFRAIEFGNWVDSKERQAHVNEAYDALMDMASICNFDPTAISLAGELALAFGARGSGRALAHYESGRVVINLTKMKGAGSLAHEWWHAIDNYFSRRRGEKRAFITQHPFEKWNYDTKAKDDRIRGELISSFYGVINSIERTKLKERSEVLDKRRSSPYWSTPIEMSARCFENYVIDKLSVTHQSNDYLANFKETGEWVLEAELELGNYPYPLKDEAPIINNAFDLFFQTLESKMEEGKTVVTLSDDYKKPEESTSDFPKLPLIAATEIAAAIERAPQPQFVRVMKNPGVVNSIVHSLKQVGIITPENKTAWMSDSTTLTENGITLLREALWKTLFPHTLSIEYNDDVTDKILKNLRYFLVLKKNSTLFLQFEIALELGKDWKHGSTTFEQYCSNVAFDDPLDAEEFAILCPFFYTDKTDKFEWILEQYVKWNGKSDRAAFLQSISAGVGERVKTQEKHGLSDVYIWK